MGEQQSTQSSEARANASRTTSSTTLALLALCALVILLAAPETNSTSDVASRLPGIEFNWDPEQSAVQGNAPRRTAPQRSLRGQARQVLPGPVRAGSELWWGAAGMIALGSLSIVVATLGWLVIVRRTAPESQLRARELAQARRTVGWE